MTYRYEIVISWSDEDQCFVAEAPELAGCLAHGDSPVAAVTNCNDAIALWIESAQSAGRDIPVPKGRGVRPI